MFRLLLRVDGSFSLTRQTFELTRQVKETEAFDLYKKTMKKEKEEARAKVDAAMTDVPAGVLGGEIVAPAPTPSPTPAAAAVSPAPVAAEKKEAAAPKAPIKWNADLQASFEKALRDTDKNDAARWDKIAAAVVTLVVVFLVF